jgi:Flp pilus assembly pilin Flp
VQAAPTLSEKFRGQAKEIPVVNRFHGLWRDETGQDLIEYTLLLAMVSLASAALFINSGASVSSIWSTSNTQLSTAATTASS